MTPDKTKIKFKIKINIKLTITAYQDTQRFIRMCVKSLSLCQLGFGSGLALGPTSMYLAASARLMDTSPSMAWIAYNVIIENHA